MALYDWSTTADDNDDADSAINWTEGQAPGTVNGSARAMMAELAKFLGDVNATLDSAGSGNAYTLEINSTATLTRGLMVAFIADRANSGACTLNVTPSGGSALGAVNLKSIVNGDLQANDIVSGQRVAAIYDGTQFLSNIAPVRVPDILPADDTTSLVQDPTDNTKQTRIDAGAITTGTTRVITMGDRDVDLASGGTFAEVSHTHALSDLNTQAAYTFVWNPTASTASPTASKISGLTEETVPASGDSFVIEDTTGALRKVDFDNMPGAAGGEVNTASNVNVGGVGVFKQKTSLDLEFKGINAGSNKITVTDDTGNNEIDIDVAEANIDHDALTNFVANEHINHSTVTITAGVGLTGGGDITTTRTLDFDVNGLTTDTDPVQSADFVPTYDASATGHKKVQLNKVGVGQQSVNLLAAGMITRTTNGASSFSTEKVTNDVMVSGFEFDAATEQAIQLMFPMPKGWNEGTVVLKFYWTTSDTAGTGNVVWGARARAMSNDDAIDGTWGTAVTVTDGFLADGDMHVTAETSALTVGNTPAEEDMVAFEIYRDADDASDTYNQTAVLIAAQMHYTTDTNTDD